MRDDAVSNGVAVLMMVATVIGVAAAVFVHVMYGAPPGPPKDVELASYAPMPDPLTKEFKVVNVTGAYNWSAVTLELDGSALHYDGSLKKSAGYCVAYEGHGCIEDGDWLPGHIPVTVGEHIIVHGSALRGKKVALIVDGDAKWEGYVNI